jgi:hypothetical protein
MVMLIDLCPKKKKMCAYNASFLKHIHNENMHNNT